jgi:glyoxylase-like metal-dependent hydrolase (beta-lactamase superfamily II)
MPKGITLTTESVVSAVPFGIRHSAFGIGVCLLLVQMNAQDLWHVYAIRYATLPDFPVASLVAGADKTRRIDIAMTVWLLEATDGRNVLFDAGFYHERFKTRWKPRDFELPSEAVARMNVRPHEVTDIIISHVHWDHLDGVDLFPSATVWIQRKEYDHYVDAAGKPKAQAIDAENAAVLAGLKKAGNLELVDGDGKEIAEGIKVHTGGRHTFESQYVSVHTPRGTVVLASDNLYLYENLERGLPIAQAVDAQANLMAQKRMTTIASDPSLVVPGHDPAVFERFPLIRPGIAAIPR